jgi:hypothetical protein
LPVLRQVGVHVVHHRVKLALPGTQILHAKAGQSYFFAHLIIAGFHLLQFLAFLYPFGSPFRYLFKFAGQFPAFVLQFPQLLAGFIVPNYYLKLYAVNANQSHFYKL